MISGHKCLLGKAQWLTTNGSITSFQTCVGIHCVAPDTVIIVPVSVSTVVARVGDAAVRKRFNSFQSMFVCDAQAWHCRSPSQTCDRCFDVGISVGAQLTFRQQDIFARKCMYEKLIKCAAKIMLCILKRKKTAYKIQNYSSPTYKTKNRILSKNKGCLFFLLPKIYQLPEYYTKFASYA